VRARAHNNTVSAVLLANPPGVLTGSTASVTVTNRWLTTVTGRLGYAWDRVLLYGKGGGAWVGSNNPAIRIDGGPFPVSTSNSNVGWIAGLGVEWTFWENWSARLEYDFVGPNGATLSFPTALGGLPGGDQFSGNNRSIQVVNVASTTNSAAGGETGYSQRTITLCTIWVRGKSCIRIHHSFPSRPFKKPNWA
jgi:outer membrane immunogenic protein